MNHVVLLGDSIFDNGAYVSGQPPVIELVQALLPEGRQATLLAVDGSVTTDVLRQLNALPLGATHLILSVGGNDALAQGAFLSKSARSVAEVLGQLAVMAEQFTHSYEQVLEAMLSYSLPTVLCIIYNPAYSNSVSQQLAVMGLMIFNDTIISLAVRSGLPIIDLRWVCTQPADFANPIEPSAIGGAKIAARIVQVVTRHDFRSQHTTVFA